MAVWSVSSVNIVTLWVTLGPLRAFTATGVAGCGSVQRFVGNYLGRKSFALGKKPRGKWNGKKEILQGEFFPGGVIWGGWEVGDPVAAGAPRGPRGWHLLALRVPSVCSLTFLHPVLPQLVSPVLSEKSLRRKMGVELVCEGREWIKEWKAAGRAGAQLALAWGVALSAKLWIIKPPTLSCYWMKYFSLWWKEAQGRCFNGCFWSENQIFPELLPTPRKTSLSCAGICCMRVYWSLSKHRVCISRPLEITFIFFPLLNTAQLCCTFPRIKFAGNYF